MPKTLHLYKCDYCDHSLKTLKGIEKHEKTCSHNPQVIEQTKVLSTIEQEVEDIRTSATSIPDLMEKIDKFLLSKGIKLHLESSPDTYSELLRNSHNSPKGYPTNWGGRGDDKGIPKGYPGWGGQWKGRVELVDHTILGLRKNLDISMWDISAGGIRSNKVPINLWFLQTGGGGGGSSFTYQGYIWLYDLPKMHEEWKQDGGEYNQLVDAFEAKRIILHQEFITHQHNYPNTIPEVIEIRELSALLADTQVRLQQATSNMVSFYKNMYAKNNPIELPDIPSAFIDTAAYKSTSNLNLVQAIDKPDVSALFEEANNLAIKADEYKQNHPEYFI